MSIRGILGTACAVAVLVPAASADPARAVVPGTFAWDYRNRPIAAPLLGYETVALSPRALDSAAADSLRAAGTRIWVWIQPVWVSWHGQPVRDYAWDRGVVGLAERFGATLRDSTGRRATLGPEGPDAAPILDFAVPGFADTLAAYVTEACARADGVLLDYGCGSVALLAPGTRSAKREPWHRGWLAFIEGMRQRRPAWRVVAQCDRMARGLDAGVDGLFLEKAGMSLNPETKVWDTLLAAVRADPREGAAGFVVRLEDRNAHRRRFFAGLALATGAAFNACDLRGDFGGGTRDRSDRDPEHFELDLGPATAPPRIVSGDLIERRFARGFVVVHRGKAAVRHACPDGVTRTLAVNDAVVAQTRDGSGHAIAARTTVGR
jgi:hypothetical protein